MNRSFGRLPRFLGVLAILAVLTGAERAARAVTGAELGRNTPHRHGRFDARLMFAPGDGVVSSMFLWKPGSELAEAYWNEIDIEKVGSDCNGYSSNAIYGDPEVQSTRRIPSDADLCAGYHIHSVEWTPDHLVWRLDGVEMRRLDGSELSAFELNAPGGMQIRFNVWVGDASFGGNFQSSSLPAHQYIDWVAYSRYTPGEGADGSDFTPLWREDFDAPLGSEWLLGTWASPLGHSVHSPANVSVAGGVGVLSLTEDAATGFSGSPPPGEPSGATAGTAGAGGADPGGAAGGGNTSSGSAGVGRATGESSCRLAPGSATQRAADAAPAWMLALLVALISRRRSRH